MAKSAVVMATGTTAVAELLAGTVSVTPEVALAMLVIEPTSGELAVIVSVAVALLARLPKLQVTTPFVCVQPP